MNRETNGYIRRAVHAILVGGVSALSLGVVAAPAGAADAAAPTGAVPTEVSLEEVIVTGLRASLQKSLEIKASSYGIVDAISAEDIGKFPDANLAAAMERIPGVTVSRAAVSLTGTGGVTTTGDASQITVRGFGPQFNQTLYDGRQVPTSLGNRGFDFGSVGSDFVNQVDVLKTPDCEPVKRCDRRDHQHQVSQAVRSPGHAIGGLGLGQRIERREQDYAER